MTNLTPAMLTGVGFEPRRKYGRLALRLLLLCACALPCAHAETTRADLLKLPAAVPFNEARVREWQPLVAEFGAKAFSEWERALYEGAIGHSDQARQWLLKAAVKGNTPEKDALCLAYKLARGTAAGSRDDLYAEMQQSEAAKQKIADWYRSAAAKRTQKQPLTPEEKAAYAGVESLPDDDAQSDKVSRQRLIICRNLTSWPSPDKLFRMGLVAGRKLPAYALNYLGGDAEEKGRLQEAARLYTQAAEAGFAPARTNQIRLQERIVAPALGDRAWEPILLGYRQQAELGDGSALIYQADLMERGSTGPVNIDIAQLLYMRGIDAGSDTSTFNQGMSYVFLALHAQERLTAHFLAGQLKLDSDEERKKYLSIGWQLKNYVDKRQGEAPQKEKQKSPERHPENE